MEIKFIIKIININKNNKNLWRHQSNSKTKSKAISLEAYKESLKTIKCFETSLKP